MHKVKIKPVVEDNKVERNIYESCPDSNCPKSDAKLYYPISNTGPICPVCDKDLYGQSFISSSFKRRDYYFDGKI